MIDGRDAEASGVQRSQQSPGRQVFILGPPTEKRPDLLDAFGNAGFDASSATGLGDVCDRVGTARPVIVLTGDDYLDLLYDIAAHPARCPVVIVGTFEHDIDFMTALQAGASGFCESRATPSAIVRTVNDVLAHGTAIPRSLVNVLVAQLQHGRGRFVTTPDGEVELSDREWEVLSLLRVGRSTSQIADLLYVSSATIRSHVSALVHKLGCSDRAEMIDLLEGQAHS